MSVAAFIDLMMAEGFSMADAVKAVRAYEAANETPVLGRSKAAERQARYIAKKRHESSLNVSDTSVDDVTDDGMAGTPPLPAPSPRPPTPPIPAQVDIFPHEDDTPDPMAKKPRRKRDKPPKYPIYETWEPDPECCQYATDQGMSADDIHREALNFRDHFLDTQAERPGWDRSWHRWCREWAERRKIRGNGYGKTASQLAAAERIFGGGSGQRSGAGSPNGFGKPRGYGSRTGGLGEYIARKHGYLDD